MPKPRGLNGRQKKFVEEYLVDLNATQAFIRAGYKARGNAAEVNAARLLRNAQVAVAIQAQQAARSARTEITQDQVLRELARIGFFDIRKLVNADGTAKSLTDLDDNTAAAIAGLDIVLIGNDTVGAGTVLKFKIAGKVAALELLGRHLAMFTDKVKVDLGQVGPDWKALIKPAQKPPPHVA